MSFSQPSTSPPASRTLARSLVPALLLFVCLFATAASAPAAVTKWTERTVPSVGAQGKLLAVSCGTTSFCVSVGWKQETAIAPRVNMADQWNGEKWTQETVPAPAGSLSAELTGVSCSLKTYCMAVGTATVGSGKQVPFAARWSAGGWTLQAPPVPPVTEGTSLSGVSCSSGNCYAVGVNKAGGVYKPIVERWDGTTWTLQVLENAPFATGVEGLKAGGISCASVNRCTAVGSYKTTGAEFKPFAASMSTGYVWTVELPAAGSGLEAISCSAVSACTATGYSGASLLAEGWNGTSWAVQTTPTPPEFYHGSLSGISCPAASTVCESVGSYQTPLMGIKPVAQRFESGAWTLDSPGLAGIPQAISCASATSCMATGYNGLQPFAATAVRVNAPTVITLPAITPSLPKTGSPATTTNGTWTEEPTKFTYQWRRCSAAGTECVNIEGATASSYTPNVLDIGKRLQSQVTAYNLAGNTTASSALTATIKE